jgi:hypothetical protein
LWNVVETNEEAVRLAIARDTNTVGGSINVPPQIFDRKHGERVA